jgi:nucleoside-diphosphate-sugar epimerase
MQPGDVDITYANIEKAKQLLGYDPSIDITTGIKNFIGWMKASK